MFTSLRSRLLLTYVIVIGVALSVVAAVLVVYIARNPTQTAQARLRLQTASEILSRRVDNLPGTSIETLHGLAHRADEAYDVRVMVYHVRGELILDSRAETEPGLLLDPAQGRNTESKVVVITEDEFGGEWLHLSQSITEEYWITLATPRPQMRILTALRSRSDELFKLFRQGGIVALILSLVFALWLARWISAPLQRMAQAAKGVAAGDYQPIVQEGPREVRSLAIAFNEMAEQVHTTQQSQRDFIANVSHELKTPLTSIQGFSQAILDGTAQNQADLDAAAQVIHDEASRMHRLVIDLLDLARLDAGTLNLERTQVDMSALLHSVVEKMRPQSVQAQVVVSLQIQHMPAMIGDGDRLSQVFTNLIDNAIKHTPQGGDVRVVAVHDEYQIVVKIIDTGVGIPPEQLARIFERFYQVDKSRMGGEKRGTGLGLAIAQEIVHAHGGTLEARSQTGQGSVFVVKLPLARPDDTTLAQRR